MKKPGPKGKEGNWVKDEEYQDKDKTGHNYAFLGDDEDILL